MGKNETNASKKRKRNEQAHAQSASSGDATAVDTSRPTAVFKPIAGRQWTVSVALPGSIIANSQTHDLRTILAGHIARALSVFCIDEVVIFADGTTPPPSDKITPDSHTGTADPDHFLMHLLSYLETPPHLRKHLFPLHPNLKSAGMAPSLDLPHHLKPDEWLDYREGVTMANDTGVDFPGTLVETGLKTRVTVEAAIPPKTRVTLQFSAGDEKRASLSKEIRAEPIDPALPREEAGYYWGFQVRRASSLSAVFEESPFEGGYDVSIGTSERGVNVQELYEEGHAGFVGRFSHLLIVFGGVAGLEVATRNDAALQKLGVTEARDMFDRWVNVCPGQGSRTIRTEEALWIGLSGVRRLVENNFQDGS